MLHSIMCTLENVFGKYGEVSGWNDGNQNKHWSMMEFVAGLVKEDQMQSHSPPLEDEETGKRRSSEVGGGFFSPKKVAKRIDPRLEKRVEISVSNKYEILNTENDEMSADNQTNTNIHSANTSQVPIPRPPPIVISSDYSPNEIIQEEVSGILDMRRLKKSSPDGSKNDISPILVTTTSEITIEDIKRVRAINRVIFTAVEYKENRGIPQCYRCQEFGHTTNLCAFAAQAHMKYLSARDKKVRNATIVMDLM
ncbi:unnamed protein product [Nezara viridula]|uniref:CCHC-type domain-containing protein n=1 Tax=Nezara viridula TaxID=85310 RepID=A0A9P0HH65_NEZVI|nr:unnamed protein product [Nezara viridula]